MDTECPITSDSGGNLMNSANDSILNMFLKSPSGVDFS